MRRRAFLRVLGVAGCAAWTRVPSRLPDGARIAQPAGKHWAWIPTELESSDEVWKQRFARMREAGITAILPEVFDGRKAYYASHHLPVSKQWLERLLPLAAAEGLETHAWVWSLPCNIPEVRERHPEWFAVNREGASAAEKPAYVDYYRFLCPSHPEVHEYVRRTVAELCQYESLAGIHLDYIRYPDVILPAALQPKYGLHQDREYPEFDYCYCDACRTGFEQLSGMDPMSLVDPSTDAAWRQFRYDRITRLVNGTLVPVAHAAGKVLTAAVFPDWALVRQQWPAWEVDGVFPMLYHTLYGKGVEWVREETAKGIRASSGRFGVYSGILVFQLSPEELTAAIEAARAGGARGVALFHGLGLTENHWQAVHKALAE